MRTVEVTTRGSGWQNPRLLALSNPPGTLEAQIEDNFGLEYLERERR
jgi:hypothetical protein